MENKAFTLEEKEAIILRDICYARMKVMHAGEILAPEGLPVHRQLSEIAARQVMKVFNFFCCVWSENEEGVKRQAKDQRNLGLLAGGGYYNGMIRDYQTIMAEQMRNGSYSEEDVLHLQNRLKGFIRAQKAPAPRTLYIADCHFCHGRLNTEMDMRGFASAEEMNEHMIRQWNAKVTSKDTVYILGDFSLAGGFQTSGILKCLNGSKHLIIGNHDDRYLKDKTFEDCAPLFRSRQHYAEIHDAGRTVILSHYPIFCYKGQYRRDKEGRPLTYMLYGHVHNTHDEYLINRFILETRATRASSRYRPEPEPIPCNMINCFCMFSDYQPMTLDEWIKIDRKRRERIGLMENHE